MQHFMHTILTLGGASADYFSVDVLTGTLRLAQTLVCMYMNIELVLYLFRRIVKQMLHIKYM